MSADAFWAFSLDVYGRPGVAAACLELQDSHGADVDVVLFALWCASRGCRLSMSQFEVIDAAVKAWRVDVVQPIRQARRALKRGFAASFDTHAMAVLRERVLADEIEAERLQQAAMAALAPADGAAAPGQAAADNLGCFARQAGIPPDIAPLAFLLRHFA